jgi:hypothetical protein
VTCWKGAVTPHYRAFQLERADLKLHARKRAATIEDQNKLKTRCTTNAVYCDRNLHLA